MYIKIISLENTSSWHQLNSFTPTMLLMFKKYWIMFKSSFIFRKLFYFFHRCGKLVSNSLKWLLGLEKCSLHEVEKSSFNFVKIVEIVKQTETAKKNCKNMRNFHIQNESEFSEFSVLSLQVFQAFPTSCRDTKMWINMFAWEIFCQHQQKTFLVVFMAVES